MSKTTRRSSITLKRRKTLFLTVAHANLSLMGIKIVQWECYPLSSKISYPNLEHNIPFIYLRYSLKMGDYNYAFFPYTANLSAIRFFRFTVFALCELFYTTYILDNIYDILTRLSELLDNFIFYSQLIINVLSRCMNCPAM